MKLITSLIIIIMGLISLNSFAEERESQDTKAMKSKTLGPIQPIYFTPSELMYKNLSYGSFPTNEYKNMSLPDQVDYKSFRTPASVENSESE